MINVESTLPAQPAPMGPLIEASFKVWLQAIKPCAPIAIAPGLIGLLPALWMPQPATPNDPAQAMAALQAIEEWMLRPSVWLLYLVLLLINLVCSGAIVYRMGMMGRGTDPGLSGAISRGIERLPAMFGGWLIYVIMLALSLMPWLTMLGMVVAKGAVDGASISIALFGSLFLLALPTWLSLAAGLFLFSTVLERRGAIASIRRSFQLVQGHWWRASMVIGVALTIYLTVVMAAAMFAGMVAAGVSVALHGMEALQDQRWMFGMQLLFVPMNAVLQLLMYAGCLAMFNDLVLRKPE